MRYGIIGLTAMVFLSGCGAEASKVPIQSKRLILPDVVEYPIDIQKKAAEEIDSGRCHVLSDVFMPDFSVMRDQTRVAKKDLKK